MSGSGDLLELLLNPLHEEPSPARILVEVATEYSANIELILSLLTTDQVARQLLPFTVTGSSYTVSLAPVAAIGSFLMVVGLAPFAGDGHRTVVTNMS